MKKYALILFQQINDKFSKWVFPLHNGENIIGSDKDVDIFLYLNDKEDKIDSVHCKIMVNESQNDVGIISLTSSGYVKRGEGYEKIILSPGKEYELNNKTIFYLTDNVKFMLLKGTIEEMHNFLLEENLENEFQKWYQYILAQENNMKVSLNLTRIESHNKSFISNNSNNDNNYRKSSINNNNNNILLNSAVSNKNLNNNNISNSILGSNTKEINRIGFNNFEEVPEDNVINDYKISQQNPINSIYISPIKNTDNKEIINKEENESNNIINNNNANNNYNNNFLLHKNLSTDITNNNNNIIIKEKETEINSLKSDNFVNRKIISKEENKEHNNNILNYNKSKDDLNSPLDLFKQPSSEVFKNNSHEKVMNKDETTLQIIKELLGENSLDNIVKNTKYKEIKKYDYIYKKTKINKSNVGLGNIDIHRRKIKNKKD